MLAILPEDPGSLPRTDMGSQSFLTPVPGHQYSLLDSPTVRLWYAHIYAGKTPINIIEKKFYMKKMNRMYLGL